MSKTVTKRLRMRPEAAAASEGAAADAGVSWSEWVTAAIQDRLDGTSDPAWPRKVQEAIERIDVTPPARRRRA